MRPEVSRQRMVSGNGIAITEYTLNFGRYGNINYKRQNIGFRVSEHLFAMSTFLTQPNGN